MKTKRCDACSTPYPAYEEDGETRNYSNTCPACGQAEVWETVVITEAPPHQAAKDAFYARTRMLLAPIANDRQRELADTVFDIALAEFRRHLTNADMMSSCDAVRGGRHDLSDQG